MGTSDGEGRSAEQPVKKKGVSIELPPRRGSIESQQTESSRGKSPTATADRPRLRASDVNRGFTPSANYDGPFSSYSQSSDKQLGHASPGPGDRVYPIRSVVSVDPTQTPFTAPGRNSSEQQEGFPGFVVPSLETPQTRSNARSLSSVSHEDSSAHPRPARRPTEPSTPSAAGEMRASSYAADRHASVSTVKSDADAMYGGGNRMQIFDTASEKSGESSMNGTGSTRRSLVSDAPGEGSTSSEMGGLVTARFKHIVTEDGHAVITGRDGETLQRCEDEPIHIPGAVQAFGTLVALREEADGQLLVRVVSENCQRLLGYSPQELFKLNSFTDILSEEQADNLLDHVDFIRDEEADPSANGPEVFTITIKGSGSRRRSTKLWCAMHVNPSSPDIIICEFELDDDPQYPLVPQNDETPEPPEDTLHSNPTEEEFAESTQITSKPLRVLRSARKRKGEAAAMEVFNIMSQVQEQLASAPTLDSFLKILCGVVKELTGFHRVMIYQFDQTFNGRVVTELVDPRATKDLYKGLNFPASDIPKQARELYKINKVRLLYDRDIETSRLVCRTLQDLEEPLDLTYSYLRAMSPIHIKYLANMAVRSSMSISINAFNELWGLIACHGYGSKGMRVSFPIRKMCRLVGDTASRNIERLSYASRLQARKLINTVPTDANPSGYIIASSDDLLTLFDADFGMLSIRGETKIMGKIEQSQEALAMLEYLRLRKMTSVLTSQDIKMDFPDLRYPPGFQVIAGLLLVPLSVGGADFIVFFRKGQVKEVKWAGNPYEKFVKEGTEGYLEPRKSFKTWSETVVGKCREWTEEQVETAAVLCLVYGKFIEVWRQKEAALQSSQLTRLLLANSAHEVRTPLNAIINYLEIALEGALDQETRDNLAKSHSASKSLIYVINDLLDLTKTEEGQELIKDEIFDLPATVREATDNFKNDARRKGIEFDTVEHPGVPQMVHGDQRRVRQIVSNLTANAVQHTTEGSVRIEMWLAGYEGSKAYVDIVCQDTGSGMSNQQLDGLFRDLEQVTGDSDDIFGNEDDAKLVSGKDKPEDKRTLGLGLAVVARIVRNMEGQLRLKSEEGKGSRFVIQLPFEVMNTESEVSDDTIHDSTSSAANIQPPVHTPPPAVEEGEVTLIDRASASKVEASSSRKLSLEDIQSLSSIKSGSSGRSGKSNRSEADRLIDAISEPLNVGVAESDELHAMRRSNSRGSGSSRRSAGSLGNAPVGSRSSIKLDRPSALSRTKSQGGIVVPEHLRSPYEGPAGSEFVTDSKTLMRAVRMPDEFQEPEVMDERHQPSSRVLFDLPDKPEHKAEQPRKQDAEHLQVLVAEDDPVNSKIIIKRMEKSGHEVHHTVNGEDCASAYGEKPAFFDVVLMDMQMPIVDGLTSTKMIRSFEKSHHTDKLSPRAQGNGRVPIFAVSASLVERDRPMYVNAGFDGWILKPIDFKRLNVLLTGIVDEKVRNKCLYKPGEWERGGWFEKRQPRATQANTVPTNETPVANPPQQGPEAVQPDRYTLSEDGSGETTPMPRAEKKTFYDEREVAEEIPPGTPAKTAEDGNEERQAAAA